MTGAIIGQQAVASAWTTTRAMNQPDLVLAEIAKALALAEREINETPDLTERAAALISAQADELVEAATKLRATTLAGVKARAHIVAWSSPAPDFVEYDQPGWKAVRALLADLAALEYSSL